jgi:hypothetical protein
VNGKRLDTTTILIKAPSTLYLNNLNLPGIFLIFYFLIALALSSRRKTCVGAGLPPRYWLLWMIKKLPDEGRFLSTVADFPRKVPQKPSFSLDGALFASWHVLRLCAFTTSRIASHHSRAGGKNEANHWNWDLGL